MIEEISIADLGVIGAATLPLGPGFTALTGETGAGKTMVVTALGLLLGDRADSSAVRSGSKQAVVEGRWSIPENSAVIERVQDAGGDVEDGELILVRSISAEGRGRAIVGGRSAPVGVLGELGEHLVVVHGQSDQMRLRSATAQRQALDRFAGPVLAAALAEYRAAFEAWQADQQQLDELVAERDRREQEAEELRESLDEIERAQPLPGEDEELATKTDRLTNLEDLRLAATSAHELLSSDAGEGADVATALTESRRQLDRVLGHDSSLGAIVEAIDTATFAVADAATALSGYLAGLDADGAAELEEMQNRRAELAILVRKYGPTLADVIARLDTGSARLLELDGDSDRIDALTDRVAEHTLRVQELAQTVTALRTEAATRLGEQVSAELAALAMPDARLIAQVTDRPEYGTSGKDQVALLLTPHPGSEPRPLGRGASGGELSRVMLALEVVIAGNDPVPTFVFDEVDAGVGGASAIEIGRRLARLAQNAQVIVVTHLAQVAAFATNHLTVMKDRDGEVTASSVRRLDGEERLTEMARLLSGLPDSASGLEHARELLENARTP